MSLPHIPWHVRAGMSDADLLAASRSLRTETQARAAKTKRERNADLWAEAFALARDAGFDSAEAARQATIEVHTAPRPSAAEPPTLRRPSRSASRFTLGDLGDRIGWVSDSALPAAFHDPEAELGPGLATDAHSTVSRARFDLIHKSEMEFAADCTAETGAVVSPEKYEAMRKNRRRLTEMTERIAEKLKAMKIAAARPDAVKCWAYWVHSKHMEQLPAYRRICILPTVAAAMRAPKLAALEYWLDRHPYARFWTFTTGARCGLRGEDGLEARIDWLTRKLSKLNHLLSRHGVEIVFRSVEFGGLETKSQSNAERSEGGGLDFAADGSPLFHPHAHCVVVAHFGYNPARWQAVTLAVRNFWRRNGERLHCDFGEIIGNARECCKYVTKPGDLLKLSDQDLAELFEITYRAKLVHPMGSLAREIRIREGHTITIERAGPIAEGISARDESIDDASGVSPDAWIGGQHRQARTLRALAAKHSVPLPALVDQNPGLPDPDTLLDYGTRVVIYPGGRCLRRVRQGRRMVWAERLDHNKTARETPAERAERESLEDAYAATAECAALAAREPNFSLPWQDDTSGALIGPCLELQGPGLRTLTAPWLDQDGRNSRAARVGSPTRILARLMPSAGPSRVKEPRVLVMSLDGRRPNLAHVQGHPLVIGLWSETVESWHAGQVLERYSVHTGTPTVQDPAPDAPPDPADGHFRAELKAFEAGAAFAEGINF
jgi:hypothetical protein